MTDVLIIGAGCAGLTAAIYARRAGKSVLVLEQEGIGGQIAYAPRVENYPGIASISGAAFSDALYEQAMALGAELSLERVLSLQPGTPHRVVTEEGAYEARAVIVAVGSRRRHLGLPNETRLSGVSYCAVCDGAFYKGRSVAVVGGGSAALQSAEFLATLCPEVHLIHRRDTFRGEQALAERVLALQNVKFHPGVTISTLLGTAQLEGLQLEGAHAEQCKVDGLFVCVGQEPNTEVFRDILEMDDAGYLKAGEDCCTNIPGIFAAGDCRSKAIRQLTTAAADGAVSALAAVGY